MANLAKGGIARAFASRNYRLFWVGTLANNLGVWINRLAIGWLTWELTHSAAWLGVMGAGAMVPMLILGPISGAMADRHGYRFQLTCATFIGSFITTVTATLVVTDLIFPELLLALVLGGGTTRSFSVPARNALVHSLVGKDDLSAAIAVNAATYQGLRFIGPAVGGFLLVAGGPGWALYTHAGLAFFTAAFLLMLRISAEGRPKAARGRFLSELADGFRYTYRHEGIRAVMVMTAVTTLFLEPYFEMLPAFADGIFKLGEEGLAKLMSATGAGAMLGGLWLAQRGRAEGLVRILAGALILGSVSLLILAWSQAFFLTLGALFVTGCALVVTGVAIQSLIQHSVAPELRARVISLNSMLVVGGPALSAILIGLAADRFGLAIPVSVSVGLGIGLWALGLPALLRHREALEGEKEAR